MTKSPRTFVLALPRGIKRFIAIISDSLLATLAVWLAYYLRLGDTVAIWKNADNVAPLYSVITAIILAIPIFQYFGLYQVIFRYSNGPTFLAAVKAAFTYGVIYALIFTLIGVDGVPRTLGIIQPIVFFLLICLSRFAALFWLSNLYLKQHKKKQSPKTLIYGAGKAGRDIASALSSSLDNKIIGFIDDDVKLQGNLVGGLPVFSLDEIIKTGKEMGISEVLLALPTGGRRRRNEILKSLSGQSWVIRTLPNYTELIQGRLTVSEIKELSIDDILGRDSIEPNPSLMQKDIKGRVILVTGAGGSIGSELCKQIVSQIPKKLVLIDHSEYALYSISKTLEGLQATVSSKVELIAQIGSVTDKARMKQILAKFHPDTIYHTAAYKHVPIVENNPFEGLKNNLFGSVNIAQLALEFEVKKFVLISTDKAVRPTNIMGASKRLAEMALQALSATKSKTVFAIVRFGNVLDSSGSVVPLFKQQIKAGGPVTVTHKDVTRYFMTISEAASLVIQAGAMTNTGPNLERGSPIYLLDMGAPVKIYDLAKRMIELSGLRVDSKLADDGDIEIQITGLRSGEKLYEELLIGDDVTGTLHPKIKVANEHFLTWPEFQKEITPLLELASANDTRGLTQILKNLNIGFQPTVTNL